MKTLVDLYPDLFDVRPSAFFANGELHISPVVKASIPQLEVKSKDYAMEPGDFSTCFNRATIVWLFLCNEVCNKK